MGNNLLYLMRVPHLPLSVKKHTPNLPVTEIKPSPAELSRTSYGHLESTVLEINLNTLQMYDKIHPPAPPFYFD